MNSLEATGQVIAALERLQIQYLLVGAFSSNAYGIPRSTKDADFEVVLESGDLARVIDQLGEDFRLDRQIQMETITGSTKNVITGMTAQILMNEPKRFQLRKELLDNRELD